MDFDKILELFRAMNREETEYIVFGAVALLAHGLVRATADLDVFVKPESENIERLKRALRSVWPDPAIDEISAAELAGDYPSVQYGPPDEDFWIDFVARLGTAFRYEDLEWQMSAIEGVPIRVVTPATLFRMKKDTVRWKDKIDAAALNERFGFERE